MPIKDIITHFIQKPFLKQEHDMKKLQELFHTLTTSDKFWLLLVAGVTFAAFAPSLAFNARISDDSYYYLNVLSITNSPLRIFDPVLKLVTPLTSLSLYLDFLLWGEKGFVTGARLTNIVLHSGVAVLFYLLLRNFKWGNSSLTPAWAGMAALIFSLHPQRVESVVWLCERKDCLAMLFGTGALLLFYRAMKEEKVSIAGALCLVLSMLAKPMWIFFFVPGAALIWMEKRNFQWKLYLKLLAPSLVIFILFLLWHVPGILPTLAGSGSTKGVSLFFKIETIMHNYGNYFIRTFMPGNLFPLYPHYNPALDPRWMALIPAALMLTPLLARKKELRPAVLYGVVPLLICFAAVLIPVVGFMRVGNTDFADRYSYLPALFLVAGAAFLLKLNLPSNSAFGCWLPTLGVLYCGGLLYQTELYIPVWKNNSTTTERSVSVQVPNFHAAISSAIHAYQNKDFKKAAEICKEKLPEQPHYPETFNNIIRVFKLGMQGLILFQLGKPDEGIRFLNTIYMSSHSHLIADFPIDFAQKLLTTGAEYHLKKYNDRQAAANLYQRCSVLFKAHSGLYEAFYAGMAALTLKDYHEAARQFARAHAFNPRETRCLQNLKFVESKLKELKK